MSKVTSTTPPTPDTGVIDARRLGALKDVDYENANVAYYGQGDCDGIKCKNYELCGTVLWFECPTKTSRSSNRIKAMIPLSRNVFELPVRPVDMLIVTRIFSPYLSPSFSPLTYLSEPSQL